MRTDGTDILDLDLDHPWEIECDEAIALAIESESAALSFDKRISNSEGATVGTNRGTRAYGNTHGFIGSYSKTSHSVTCVVLAESDGTMQRDYHYTSSRVPGDLEDAAAVGGKAAEKTLSASVRAKSKQRMHRFCSFPSWRVVFSDMQSVR